MPDDMPRIPPPSTPCRRGRKTVATKAPPVVPLALRRLGLISGVSRLRLVEDAYLREAMLGIMSVCEQDRIDLNILSIVDPDHLPQPREVSGMVDGVLLLAVINDDYIAGFVDQHVPLVVLDYQTDRLPIDCLACDNAPATRAVLEYLFALGHRRIAYLDGTQPDPLGRGTGQPADEPDCRERRNAYKEGMAQHGLEAFIHVIDLQGRLMPKTLPKIVDRIQHLPDPPTAVLAYDTVFAAHFCKAALAAGMRIPQEISVAAAAGTSADARWLDETLTYSRMRFRDMGAMAVRRLQERYAAPRPDKPGLTRIGFDFCPGTTTAPNLAVLTQQARAHAALAARRT